MVTINDIPIEILENILYFVSPYQDLKYCRLVCHKWYHCCHRVVKKHVSRFTEALKAGCIEWIKPPSPEHLIPITQRHSHSACIHNSSMYVFGGCTLTNTTFNDLWRFDLNGYEWKRLLTIGTYPSPKAYASMVNWKDNLILFGGWTHPSVYPLHQQWVLFNELHIYEILANRWTQIYCSGSPPPTAGHTSTVHGNYLIVIGGLQRQDGSSTSTNDVYCLDLEEQIWFKPTFSRIGPEPRYGHSQIKLDDQHLLLIAGCGGSNKLYSDVWLLTIPEPSKIKQQEWVWESILVEGNEHLPSQIWYNPACKVGDHAVVLSTWHGPPPSVRESNKMNQLLVPGLVRWQASAPNVWQPSNEQRMDHSNEQPAIAENNVNGHRGSLRGADESRASSSAQNRIRPSIRPNASSNRERRLEMLSKMERRLKTISNNSPRGGVMYTRRDPIYKKFNKKIVVPHLLDISKAMTKKVVRWLPVSLDKDGIPPFIGISPSPCLLYTLLLGRGHLIMFGGIPNDPSGSYSSESLSNLITFISAPTLSY